jgi:hypothetical protein
MSSGVPHHVAKDPAAPVVTRENLMESERFWPYKVALTRAWTADGATQSPPVGFDGVLIRVEDRAVARIDFGRDGLHSVPVDATDLVERANRVRLGETEKTAPNFVLAIGPRLVDPFVHGAFAFRRFFGYDRYLAVFARVDDEGFEDMARSLEPLRRRGDLLTIFFPLGRTPDVEVRKKLNAVGWNVPYVFAHLSDPYARSLLSEGNGPPAVALQTAEGRVLFESGWTAETPSALSAALGASSDETVRAAAADSAGP